MRALLSYTFILWSICANAQTGFNVDSLYRAFNRQLSKGDSSAWVNIKKLESLAQSDPTAGFYFDLARSGSYLAEGAREQAFGAAMDALDKAREMNCDSLLFRVYNKIGVLYMDNNDLLRALPYLGKAALLVGSVKDLDTKILLFRDMALLYSYLDKNKEAIEYYLRIEPMILKTGNKKFLGNVYNNLGICYMDLRDTAKALDYFRRSLAIRYEVKDDHGIAQVHNNLGTLYLNKGEYPKALDFFVKGLELRKNANVHVNGIIESNINIGKTYYKLKQIDKARTYLEGARSEALKIAQIELERRADEELMQIYSEAGDYRKAFEVQARYFLIKDSLYGLDKKEEVGRMTFENKLREDSLKHEEARQKEIAVHTEKQKRAALVRNISVAGFVLVLFVAFILFKQVKKIRAANKIIADQKDQIEQKQKEVLDSIHYARRIQQSLLASESYISRNLKRLKDRSS